MLEKNRCHTPFSVFTSPHPAAVWAFDLRSVHAHVVQVGSTASSTLLVGRGVVAWADAGKVTVEELSTGRRAGPFTVPALASGGPGVWWQDGTVETNQGALPIPFLAPYTHTLPAGYQWARIGNTPHPIIVVPGSFTVT
jgi:hypothetical protein